MVMRFYQFFFLFLFASCGEMENPRTPQGDSSYLNHLRQHAFSAREEEALLKNWNSLKTLKKVKYSPEEASAMIEGKLMTNEAYERALYRVYLPDRDPSEVRRKYQILRKIGYKSPESVPDHRILDAIIKTYRDFGSLYISESRDYQGVTYESATVPWAGHWYPFREDTLYKDENTALGKLDQLVKIVKGYHPGIRQEFKKKALLLGKGAVWNGNCDGRSFASVAKIEPPEEVIVKGIKFTRGDLKGILTIAHSGFNPEYDKEVIQYGTTYSRSYETDGSYEDVNPMVIQKIAEMEIGQNKRSVVVNETVGQVWNVPMFAYDFKVSKDPKNKNAFLVKANPRFVNYRHTETDALTSRMDLDSKEYTYRFWIDRSDKKYVQENGIRVKKYRVISGEWIGDSVRNHPDHVKVIKIGSKYKTLNRPLSRNLDILDLLFKPKREF